MPVFEEDEVEAVEQLPTALLNSSWKQGQIFRDADLQLIAEERRPLAVVITASLIVLRVNPVQDISCLDAWATVTNQQAFPGWISFHPHHLPAFRPQLHLAYLL